MKCFRFIFLGIIFMTVAAADTCYSGPMNIYEVRANSYLAEGRIKAGVAELTQNLAADPGDDSLRFAVGFLQFVRAVEKLGQAWHRYGLRTQRGFASMIPFLRIPVPQREDPLPITNRDFRKTLNDFIDDLAACEETLSSIRSDAVSLSVFFGRAHFDFDADGQVSEQEALWRIYQQLNRGVEITAQQASDFVIKFDAGDVKWLRAYCHLLSGFLEVYLTYDDSRLFAHTAHLFFEKPQIPYDFLLQRKQGQENYWADYGVFLDAIALVHLLDFPVQEAERSRKALAHFRQVTALSRESWRLYRAETDDDWEWIPNPGQTGVIPGVKVTAEMVQQWLAFLDEIDNILSGEKLIPFWRGTQEQGVNLKRVFTDPRRFDLILWVQGTAAAPYLEKGILTSVEFWNQLMQSFNGRFVGFALWFN